MEVAEGQDQGEGNQQVPYKNRDKTHRLHPESHCVGNSLKYHLQFISLHMYLNCVSQSKVMVNDDCKIIKLLIQSLYMYHIFKQFLSEEVSPSTH